MRGQLDAATTATGPATTIDLQLPNPEDEQLSEPDFLHQVETAWLVCDRFDLQTDIWRGRILRTIRDREKRQGDARGSGFLNWLKDQEISKTQAYALIELADSADTLLEDGQLEPAAIERFSKRAFIETAQAAPEVQQLVTEAAQRGDRITRRQVRQLADEWTAMTSELVPPILKEKAADQTIPTRYLPPLIRELEKLPVAHQEFLQAELTANPDVDTLKQATAEARYLAKYLSTAAAVQGLPVDVVDLEQALTEALRLGCLNIAADLVSQAAQLEQTLARLYNTWSRVGSLVDRLHTEVGSSTPQLRLLLQYLEHLGGEVLEIQLGEGAKATTVRLKISIE